MSACTRGVETLSNQGFHAFLLVAESSDEARSRRPESGAQVCDSL